jgi:broad specificity phosphatase PhoE
MRWLEVRRHSLTKKGGARGHGSHLSADGVLLARRLGEALGSMECVFTSDVPRAAETALAMGYAVDEAMALPSGYVDDKIGHHEQWTWPQPYNRYGELLRASVEVRAVADTHLAAWRLLMSRVRDGASGLFIGHGGALELAVVAAVGPPDPGGEGWGPPLSHGDGFRLSFVDGRFGDPAPRRAPAGRQR